MSATWAQKPEKPEKVEVVVKSIEDIADATDPLARIESDAPVAVIAGTAELVDDGKTDVRVVVKTDESPEVVVSGSLNQALDNLKKQIKEIGKKSPRSEQDQKRLKALDQALSELTKAIDQIKSLKAGTNVEEIHKDGDHVVVLRRFAVDRKATTESEKSSEPEKQAQIEKTRIKIKQLTAELEAKHKELVAAQSELAKLGGGPQSAPVLVWRVQNKVVGNDKNAYVVRHVDVKPTIVERKEIRRLDGKSPTLGEIKKVDPTQGRIELEIHSDVKSPTIAEVKKVDPTQGRIELKIGSDDGLAIDPMTKSGRVVGAVKVRSEQQRIEELERTLKKLLNEVDSLKKDREKGAVAK
jgi:hypothetical protein